MRLTYFQFSSVSTARFRARDLNMRPVELGKGGAYSEILRMLLDAGASPFMQRIPFPALHPPKYVYDGNVPDDISGNVGFTALHYAVLSTCAKSRRPGIVAEPHVRLELLLGLQPYGYIDSIYPAACVATPGATLW